MNDCGGWVFCITALAVLVVGCSSPASPHSDIGRATSIDVGSDDVAVDASHDPDVANVGDTHDVTDMRVAPDANAPFNEVVFPAIHNSYSGGGRGSIEAQLLSGIRFIEFDVHADDFATFGYRVGHDDAGDEVETGAPNPDGTSLVEWLGVVRDWRDANPDHLPLTIGLDLKDQVSGLATEADGNLAALNALLDETFGSALFTEADAADGWPSANEMRGRVLIVLSGNTTSRLDYRRTVGMNPAIAGVVGGPVVVAHDSADMVRVWSGTATGMRTYEIVEGRDPAIAMRAGAVVLFVVRDGALHVRDGVLGAGGTITWSSTSMAFEDGEPAQNPSIRFTSDNTVLEVHETAGGELKAWEGQWLPSSGGYAWTETTPPTARFDEANDDGLTVTAVTEAPYTDLLVIEGSTVRQRVRLQQRMFSESQYSGPAEFEQDGVYFYAAGSLGVADVAWATEKRATGNLVRIWQFNLPNVTPTPPPNFPATDRPTSDWYIGYCASVGCLVE